MQLMGRAFCMYRICSSRVASSIKLPYIHRQLPLRPTLVTPSSCLPQVHCLVLVSSPLQEQPRPGQAIVTVNSLLPRSPSYNIVYIHTTNLFRIIDYFSSTSEVAGPRQSPLPSCFPNVSLGPSIHPYQDLDELHVQNPRHPHLPPAHLA
jgi:hypothetical protein